LSGTYTAPEGLIKCVHSEDDDSHGPGELIYSMDDDDDQRPKHVPNDSDDEDAGQFLQIYYLDQKTYHATSKSHNGSTGNGGGNGCADSAAPGKLESAPSALDSNDEARSIVPLGSFVSAAPGKLESTSSAMDANEAERPRISQRITQPPTTTTTSNATHSTRTTTSGQVSQSTRLKIAAGHDDIDHGIIENLTNDVYSDSDEDSDIENALPCLEVKQTSDLVPKKKNKVTWAVPDGEFSEMMEDRYDSYRYFSISRVPPQQRDWIPHKLWKRYPKAHVRKHEKDDTRLKWKTQKNPAERNGRDTQNMLLRP
jgi:hypothetical protein